MKTCSVAINRKSNPDFDTFPPAFVQSPLLSSPRLFRLFGLLGLTLTHGAPRLLLESANKALRSDSRGCWLFPESCLIIGKLVSSFLFWCTQRNHCGRRGKKCHILDMAVSAGRRSMPSKARTQYLVTNVTPSQHAAAKYPGPVAYPPSDLSTLSPRRQSDVWAQ